MCQRRADTILPIFIDLLFFRVPTMALDCIVCGECCVDIPVRPVPIDSPLRDERVLQVDPIPAGSGGIVSNSGLAMARLGLEVAALACVGTDNWADHLLSTYQAAGIDTSMLIHCEDHATSVTVVLIDQSGEHAFIYHPGASQQLSKEMLLGQLDNFSRAQFALVGYYGLLPDLEQDLPSCLAAIRETGCRVAMDAGGGGGSLTPLDQILPHLDIYFPSYNEALSQTGQREPRQMIETLRGCGTDAVIGITLGDQGALLSPAAGEWLTIDPLSPPGDVIDTTAAGDSFFAGFIAGSVQGLSAGDSGRLAAATGACCVTGLGVKGIRPVGETMKLAGLE